MKLTTERNGNGWRYGKRYRGKRFRSETFSATSRDNERKAIRDYKHWKERLDQQLDANAIDPLAAGVVERIGQVAEFARLIGNRDVAAQLDKDRQSIRTLEDAVVAGEFVFGNPELDQMVNFARVVKEAEGVEHDTAGQLSRKFIESTWERHSKGKLTAGRAERIRQKTESFIQWFGADTRIEKLNNEIVSQWYEREESKEGWKIFKLFVQHCFRSSSEFLLPRILEDPSFVFDANGADTTVWEKDEIHLFVQNATRRTQLYFLLILNCAMTQADIGALHRSMINWQSGRIRYRRTKLSRRTDGKGDKTPFVNYKLWPSTFRLLQEEASQGDLVLTNANGDAVWLEGRGADGKAKKNDNIANAFFRVLQKLKNRNLIPSTFDKRLKHLRKTGSNTLFAGEKKDWWQYWLGHSEFVAPSTADRHYRMNGPIITDFDDTVEWLGRELELYEEFPLPPQKAS